MSEVDSARFRQLCGRFATGVIVVTTTAPDGSPAGMTANSFTSVSLNPPLVSVNIEHVADFHALVTASDGFVINILEQSQEALSRRFAGPARQRFDGVGYHETDRGRIELDGVIAAIECDRHSTFEVGDHTVVIGLVVGGTAHDGRPLLYFRGGYQALG